VCELKQQRKEKSSSATKVDSEQNKDQKKKKKLQIKWNEHRRNILWNSMLRRTDGRTDDTQM